MDESEHERVTRKVNECPDTLGHLVDSVETPLTRADVIAMTDRDREQVYYTEVTEAGETAYRWPFEVFGIFTVPDLGPAMGRTTLMDYRKQTSDELEAEWIHWYGPLPPDVPSIAGDPDETYEVQARRRKMYDDVMAADMLPTEPEPYVERIARLDREAAEAKPKPKPGKR